MVTLKAPAFGRGQLFAVSYRNFLGGPKALHDDHFQQHQKNERGGNDQQPGAKRHSFFMHGSPP